MGFFGNFFGNVFGRSRDTNAESGGRIIITSSSNTTETADDTAHETSMATTLQRNNATMLKQLSQTQQYRSIIEEAAKKCQLPPSLICGIGSRESHWGLALRPAHPGGTGDHSRRRPRGSRSGATPPDGGGYGRGLMQIDYDWHEFARTGNWQDPRSNLMYACEVINRARIFFRRKNVPEAEMTRAIIAAYNAGATATYSCIQSRQNIDCKTTGRDYSEDVLNRAGWFQLHGWR